MMFFIVRLRFRAVLFVLIIIVVTVGTIVGGIYELIADKAVFLATLAAIGRDFDLV